LQLKTKLLLLTLYLKLDPLECLGLCKKSLLGVDIAFQCQDAPDQQKYTAHEQNYYNASLALCFYLYYCREKELHLKIVEIIFVKKQQLGTKQGPSIP